jgi:hypothetical protein
MKKYFILMGLLAGLLGFKKGMEMASKPADVSAAVVKCLPVLERSSHLFLKNAAPMVLCHSCHNQGLGIVAFEMAKERGLPVNDTIFTEAIDSTQKQWKTYADKQALMEENEVLPVVITGSYDLWALAEVKYPADKMIHIISRNIMRKQSFDGSWQSPGKRPPLEYYSFSLTALTVKNMQAYMPVGLKDEVAARVARAKEWMMRTEPVANEEKAYQLLGLTWCNGDQPVIYRQAQKLLKAQHPDGGWSQLSTLPTDAYATGQSLYALVKSGQLGVDDPAYRRGVDFLLRTQEPDGSWHVRKRAFPFVPYVNSGFPHGDDQFISAAGSNWAIMALMLSVKNENLP